MLATTLVFLLSDLNRLSDIQTNISHFPHQTSDGETASILDLPPPVDLYATLTRQLSQFQVERLASQAGFTWDFSVSRSRNCSFMVTHRLRTRRCRCVMQTKNREPPRVFTRPPPTAIRR